MRKIFSIFLLGTFLFSFGAVTRAYADDTTSPTFTQLLYPLATPYTTQNPFGVWVYVSDNVGVTSVTWSNDTGSSGNGVYNGSCFVTVIPMVEGMNNITFVASDAAGNTAEHTINISYVYPDPSPAQGATVVPNDAGQLLRVTLPQTISATIYYGTSTDALKSTTATIVDDYVQAVIPYGADDLTANGTNYWYVEVTNAHGTTWYPPTGFLSFTAKSPTVLPSLNLLLLN